MRSIPARLFALLSAVLTVAALQGCGAQPDTAGDEGDTTYGATITPGAGDVGDDAEGDVGDDITVDGPLTAVDDGAVGTVSTALAVNGKMRATANVNLRTGAGTSFSVIAVIPSGTVVTLVSATPKSGFLNIQFNGTSGWSSATYLTEVASSGAPSSGGTVDLDGAPSPDNAIARAKTVVGFSYFWGGGGWLASGATSSNKGSCTGSCPSCSHSGKYGADCSGLIAKAWQFGAKAIEVNSHPYSTADFVSPVSGKWSNIARGSLRKGDALVYRSGGAGHIVMYEKGDGWGTPTVIECRACAAGCVYNARSIPTAYKAIRRAGF